MAVSGLPGKGHGGVDGSLRVSCVGRIAKVIVRKGLKMMPRDETGLREVRQHEHGHHPGGGIPCYHDRETETPPLAGGWVGVHAGSSSWVDSGAILRRCLPHVKLSDVPVRYGRERCVRSDR